VNVGVPVAPTGFAATIRNKNTRLAYYRAVTDFFAWLDAAGIVALIDIEPLHVATYIEALQERMAKPTVKQHLAAIRMLFDWLVTVGRLRWDWRVRSGI
jgi:site-specific recombinase XerD